jgi:hypothetical protein
VGSFAQKPCAKTASLYLSVKMMVQKRQFRKIHDHEHTVDSNLNPRLSKFQSLAASVVQNLRIEYS